MLAAATAYAVLGPAHPAGAAGLRTARVSVAADGAQAYVASLQPAVSADGRFAAFASTAPALVPDDGNFVRDIFVKDLTTGSIERVSVDDDGAGGDGDSEHPSISADGRYVVFASHSTNLVSGDTLGLSDVFLRDRTAGTTVRVSVPRNGVEGNGHSFEPAISADGGHVAFTSRASNLTSGAPPSNSAFLQVFLKNLGDGTVARVSQTATGDAGDGSSDQPVVSDGGAFVAFKSFADNLVGTSLSGEIAVRDATGRIDVVSVGQTSTVTGAGDGGPAMSRDGRWVAFLSKRELVNNDGNGRADVFVRDRDTGTTMRASESSTGVEANNRSWAPAIGPDGRYVSFAASATNLVPSDTNAQWDVFVKDLSNGATERVSVRNDGSQGNGGSFGVPAVTEGGGNRRVAFESAATNLVAGDINDVTDIFVSGAFVVGAAPPPPVPAGLVCDWAPSAIVCDLSYGGGPAPVIRWYFNQVGVRALDNQRLVTRTCVPNSMVAVRVEVVDDDIPTAELRRSLRCYAIPP
jgi:Tol biopolymer transport system component